MNMLLSPKMKSRRFKHHLAEINELIKMGYTHQEIVDYLRESRDLDLQLNTFRSYLQRSKQVKTENLDYPVAIQSPIIESKIEDAQTQEQQEAYIRHMESVKSLTDLFPETRESVKKRINDKVADLMRSTYNSSK